MKKEDIDKGRRGKSENGVEGEGEKGKMLQGRKINGKGEEVEKDVQKIK